MSCKTFRHNQTFQPTLSRQIVSLQSHTPAFGCSPMNESPVSYYRFPPCSVGRETALCAKNKSVFTLLVNENTTTAKTIKFVFFLNYMGHCTTQPKSWCFHSLTLTHKRIYIYMCVWVCMNLLINFIFHVFFPSCVGHNVKGQL